MIIQQTELYPYLAIIPLDPAHAQFRLKVSVPYRMLILALTEIRHDVKLEKDICRLSKPQCNTPCPIYRVANSAYDVSREIQVLKFLRHPHLIRPKHLLTESLCMILLTESMRHRLQSEPD
jgi:hypothetical protein